MISCMVLDTENTINYNTGPWNDDNEANWEKTTSGVKNNCGIEAFKSYLAFLVELRDMLTMLERL